MDSDTLALGERVSEAWLYVDPTTGPAVGREAVTKVLEKKAEEVEPFGPHRCRGGDRHQDERVAERRLEPVGLVARHVAPDDRRVGPIPEDWPNGTRCIIGTARVIGYAAGLSDVQGAAFLLDLSYEDLAELRRQTRAVARQYGRTLTDKEADQVIMEAGPAAAERALRAGRD